ncbi:hypothetical protein [Pseudovibrio sp. POLY-S9]|uniref:hypothetical protein n=1 Tax=Pseudovibrio sp. POLY-S9 TaxID=1576596 RepID=UPI0007104879|nr:hypothetical protein [Pseudovibrio sp. POLY-S9]
MNLSEQLTNLPEANFHMDQVAEEISNNGELLPELLNQLGTFFSDIEPGELIPALVSTYANLNDSGQTFLDCMSTAWEARTT